MARGTVGLSRDKLAGRLIRQRPVTWESHPRKALSPPSWCCRPCNTSLRLRHARHRCSTLSWRCGAALWFVHRTWPYISPLFLEWLKSIFWHAGYAWWIKYTSTIAPTWKEA